MTYRSYDDILRDRRKTGHLLTWTFLSEMGRVSDRPSLVWYGCSYRTVYDNTVHNIMYLEMHIEHHGLPPVVVIVHSANTGNIRRWKCFTNCLEFWNFQLNASEIILASANTLYQYWYVANTTEVLQFIITSSSAGTLFSLPYFLPSPVENISRQITFSNHGCQKTHAVSHVHTTFKFSLFNTL